MYELYPYFTNDSSVGLFSRQDDDIYHSTYGALSESWQKFIIPSGLQRYMQEHESVKILDICYGIGYNTKTSLQVFIENFFNQINNSKLNFKNNSEKNQKNINSVASNIATIDTDNIIPKRIDNSKGKNHHAFSHLVPINIEEIDTNNIQVENEKILNENYYENSYSEFSSENQHDNVNIESESNFGYNSIYNTNFYYAAKAKNMSCNNILIDAVDLDKTLFYLSPFIADASKFNFLFKNNYEISHLNKNKYNQIQNLKRFRSFIKKEFILKKEVSIILFKKLLDSNQDFFNDAILQTILNHKKYQPFLSRFMINFANFYLNLGYNYNKNQKKSGFLHNIYSLYATLRERYRQYIE